MSGSLIWNNDDYRKEPAMTAPTDAPFLNCQFKHCDLPGQCLGEGKCHHPKPDAPQESKTPRTDEARISAYGEFGIEGQAFTAVPVDVARQLETELAERTKELAEANEFRKRFADLFRNGGMEDWAFIFGQATAEVKLREQAEATLANRDAEVKGLQEAINGMLAVNPAANDGIVGACITVRQEHVDACRNARAALTRKDGK